jgi:hypothetical protein
VARGEGHPVGRERGRGSRGEGGGGEAGVGLGGCGSGGRPGAGQAGSEVEQESDADRHGAGISSGSCWRGWRWPCRADRAVSGWRGEKEAEEKMKGEEARDIWARSRVRARLHRPRRASYGHCFFLTASQQGYGHLFFFHANLNGSSYSFTDIKYADMTLY